MTLSSFLSGVWNDFSTEGTKALTQPAYIFGGIENVAKTVGDTASDLLTPILIPILLIVFVFAISGGKVF
jgi:hypothetical protein